MVLLCNIGIRFTLVLCNTYLLYLDRFKNHLYIDKSIVIIDNLTQKLR